MCQRVGSKIKRKMLIVVGYNVRSALFNDPDMWSLSSSLVVVCL